MAEESDPGFTVADHTLIKWNHRRAKIESEGAVARLPVPVLHVANILVQLVVLKLNKVVKEAAKRGVDMADKCNKCNKKNYGRSVSRNEGQRDAFASKRHHRQAFSVIVSIEVNKETTTLAKPPCRHTG